MKILYVWDADYPWDIRVEKVCNSFISRGHEVHLVCRNQKRNVRYEHYKGIHLHRLVSLPKFLGPLNSVFTFPAFFSPIWLWEIYRQARFYQCEVIFVRDLPMAPAAVLIGKLLGIRIIIDMAECYPEILRAIWRFEAFRLGNVLVRNPFLADIVEHVTLRLVDSIVVMIEESRDRLIRKGIPAEKIFIVSNTPVLSQISTTSKSHDESLAKQDRALKLVYVGLLNPSRGLDTVIQAVARYVKSNKRLEFHVVGSGKALPLLKRMVREHCLDDKVRFLGWLDHREATKQIDMADVGIVPHHRCSHWESTIPNKLFDYMAAGKPVIVSDVRPVARIVNATDCGIVYEDGNPDSLVDTFSRLEDGQVRERLGNNGQEAVLGKYNWEAEEKVLLGVLEMPLRE